MATAARPTFEPARSGRGKGEGDLSQLSKQRPSLSHKDKTQVYYSELEERERVSCCMRKK
jgi:protein CWC15